MNRTSMTFAKRQRGALLQRISDLVVNPSLVPLGAPLQFQITQRGKPTARLVLNQHEVALHDDGECAIQSFTRLSLRERNEPDAAVWTSHLDLEVAGVVVRNRVRYEDETDVMERTRVRGRQPGAFLGQNGVRTRASVRPIECNLARGVARSGQIARRTQVEWRNLLRSDTRMALA
jgi:hypothetical protein